MGRESDDEKQQVGGEERVKEANEGTRRRMGYDGCGGGRDKGYDSPGGFVVPVTGEQEWAWGYNETDVPEGDFFLVERPKRPRSERWRPDSLRDA